MSELAPLEALTFQSTLPAWGSDDEWQAKEREAQVSIHAPRVGERRLAGIPVVLVDPFQSTLPAWGSDVWEVLTVFLKKRFNPRSPRGGATRLAAG